MDPHSFEQDGVAYEVSFERTPEGWLGRICGEDGATLYVVAFPNGIGFDPDDVRGSLIAGCRAVVARHRPAAPTRH